MNCRDIDEVLEPYIRGELATDQTRAVAEHLTGCERCQAAYEDTRTLVTMLLDAGEALQPAASMVPLASAPPPDRTPIRVSRGWIAVAATLAALTVASATLLTVPALAKQVPLLPVTREIAALEADTAELSAQVAELEVRLAEVDGEQVTLVETEPVLDAADNTLAQEHAIAFVRAMYGGDEDVLQALATPALAEHIAEQPTDYLREGGVVFAQITNVAEHEGSYWVFIRMSDTVEFTDSQFQLNIALERDGSGEGFLVSAVEMDA